MANIEEIITTARQKRDESKSAAQALAERDDFNPDDETYRGLMDDATKQNAKIKELVALQDQVRAMNEVDSKILNTSAPSGVTVGKEEDIYRRGGPRSFFRDLYHAQHGNIEAREYLDKHTRAMTTAAAAGGGGNVVPPKYMAELFAPDPKWGAPVAASFAQFALGDATAFKVPRQLTSGTVDNQSAENAHPTPSDQTFDQLTVTPVTKTGSTVVSRQLLDGSNPAIDQIIAYDLRGELLEAADALATTTLLAVTPGGSSTPTGTADVLLDAIITAIPAVYGARKQPADTIYMSPATFGYLATAKDSEKRYLLNAYSPMNAAGVGITADNTMAIGGLPVVVAPQIAIAHAVVVAKRSDFAWFSGPVFQFRYEEKAGPESIELGVWQYQAALCGRYPTGIYKIMHTAGALVE